MTKQQLIEDNMDLVYFIIRKYYPKYIDDEDIIQCGMVGLCIAAEKWDEEKGAFSTYASTNIRYAIWNEFRRYRNKHSGVLSLDYEYYDEDEPKTFKDTIVGEDGVDIVDYQALYDKLTPTEKKIFDYTLDGLSNVDIGKKIGLSRQRVSHYLRKIRIKWKIVYGDEE